MPTQPITAPCSTTTPPGLPVVLVTHQFTITGFTSGPTASGSGSLFQLNGSGNPQWLGTLGDP